MLILYVLETVQWYRNQTFYTYIQIVTVPFAVTHAKITVTDELQRSLALRHLISGIFKHLVALVTVQPVSTTTKHTARYGAIGMVMKDSGRKPVKTTIIVPVSYRVTHRILWSGTKRHDMRGMLIVYSQLFWYWFFWAVDQFYKGRSLIALNTFFHWLPYLK